MRMLTVESGACSAGESLGSAEGVLGPTLRRGSESPSADADTSLACRELSHRASESHIRVASLAMARTSASNAKLILVIAVVVLYSTLSVTSAAVT